MRSLVQANSVNCKAPFIREKFEPFSVPLNCVSPRRQASSQHSHFMEARQRLRGVILSSVVWPVWADGQVLGSQHQTLSLPSHSSAPDRHSLGAPTSTSSDRVPGELPQIFDRDEDAQKAETIGETEGPKCSSPLSTPPASVRTPVLVVASNPTAQRECV